MTEYKGCSKEVKDIHKQCIVINDNTAYDDVVKLNKDTMDLYLNPKFNRKQRDIYLLSEALLFTVAYLQEEIYDK